ncbi:glycosyltransferase family 1 protein [Pelagibius litoralis]|uniref:Glycosyltransferase family 1 protein n=1 Tax=Pelagibius litoralis TaxID=374515 RepID=A0A967C885_9PROT|nr:glycosyltransferase [Pelagibius litoralis]NIA68227.1 glycosyltransferase family 1 protein [Pelagibius litoralis]
MRILILTLGSRGDVQPYVALGAALRARGHDVTLSTGQGFETMIEAQGLAAAPLSDDVRAMIQTPEIQKALRTFSGKIRAWRASKGLYRRQLDEMWAVAQAVRPEIIVYHHPKGLAAQHIAEALQIVAVPTALIPAYIPTAAFPSPGLPLGDLGPFGNRLSHRAVVGLMHRLLAGQVGKWRRERLGLDEKGPRDLFGSYHPKGFAVPRLHGFSRLLVPPASEWGPQEKVTGYWFSEPTADWQPPPALLRFLDAGPPPVYVGFGSMPGADAARLTRSVVDALRSANRRGVLATGWGGLADVASPAHVHVLEAAPHDWLFPRCAAVVHHGGAGTTHEGLRWGRPSIICPVFGDQPFWGRRVASVGAGPPPLPQKRLTAETLAGALAATESPAIRARAAEIGSALRAEPGAEGAAAAIDAMIAAWDTAPRFSVG